MRKAMVCAALSGIALCLLLAGAEANDLRAVFGEPNIIPASRPTRGVILVTVRQAASERSRFYTVNNEVKTSLGESDLSQLKARGLIRSRVVYKGGGECTYALFFDRPGAEPEIVRWLETQSWVVRARLDHPLQLLAEPNDFYYQPDSLDYSKHWVYEWCRWPNSANYRACRDSSDLNKISWTCCCEDSCDMLRTDWTWSWVDNLRMSDQWYLQRVRANRAWDIEKGNPSVKIMVIDSGIDIDHPELDNHIWDNSSVDPKGDANRDGLPGSPWGFADPRINKDIDGDGLELYETDGECDCGADGDYV